MSTVLRGKDIHPFLRGNFAPVTTEFISHPCRVILGEIPRELWGGQYIRNGGNPVYPPDKGRHYHWFDGDGMLHGVLFPNSPDTPPLYTNRHLATPLLTLTLLLLRSPIPSIALLISPLSSLHRIVTAIVLAVFIAIRARLGVLSVANTSVIWWGQGLGQEAAEENAKITDERDESLSSSAHTSITDLDIDNRLLATCESGPPLEVRLPDLETVGWDRLVDPALGETLLHRRGMRTRWRQWTLSRIQEDWMTAHPRVDPIDGSLIFYSTQMFDTPHVRYSVIDRKGRHVVWKEGVDVGRAKMMHDFAATRSHTILLNLPLTLSPHNLLSTSPVPLVHFDRSLPSEFVIFPRLLRSSQTPQEPFRCIDPQPSLIFHTANAWDEVHWADIEAINMLGCRFRSAKLIYAAGAVDVPKIEQVMGQDDVVQLHYYRFVPPRGYLSGQSDESVGTISHSFPLSAVPFEFPTLPSELGMSDCRFVYGCTMKTGSFDERLGGAAKVDCLVKLDVHELVEKGRQRGGVLDSTPVDSRSTSQILTDLEEGIKGPIEIFALPDGWFAQESRFVPRVNSSSEDDGYLLTYVYDESYILPDGTPSSGNETGSELWVIDARRMRDGLDAVVCRVKLPQRVPYGLHGTWISQACARKQRSLPDPIPIQPLLQDKLALSRLRSVASIIFSRPTSRDRSWFERVVLGLLWPSAIGLLILAILEAVVHKSQFTGRVWPL